MIILSEMVVNGIKVKITDNMISFSNAENTYIEGEISGDGKSIQLINPFKGLPREFNDATDIEFLRNAVSFLTSEWLRYRMIAGLLGVVIENFSMIEEIAIRFAYSRSGRKWIVTPEFDAIFEEYSIKIKNAESPDKMEEYKDTLYEVIEKHLNFHDIREAFIKHIPAESNKVIGKEINVNEYLYIRCKKRAGKPPDLVEFMKMRNAGYWHKGIYDPLESEFCNLLMDGKR